MKPDAICRLYRPVPLHEPSLVNPVTSYIETQGVLGVEFPSIEAIGTGVAGAIEESLATHAAGKQLTRLSHESRPSCNQAYAVVFQAWEGSVRREYFSGADLLIEFDIVMPGAHRRNVFPESGVIHHLGIGPLMAWAAGSPAIETENVRYPRSPKHRKTVTTCRECNGQYAIQRSYRYRRLTS